MTRLATAAALVLPVVLTGCRRPPPPPSSETSPTSPVAPVATQPVITSPVAATATANPNAAALARAYLAEHHLNWGVCVLSVTSFDGDVMMTFGPSGPGPADPHTLLVHPDGTVTAER